MKKIKKWFKENKKFTLASALMIGTGVLDCYLTSKGLKDKMGVEGNPYYANLIEHYGISGLYFGKLALESILILSSRKYEVIFPLNTGTASNFIGAASWIVPNFLYI